LNRPIDDDGDFYERRADPNRSDREISLGTATILGIFFGLAVVCACFFGFGYTMGHNSARTAESAAVEAEPTSGMTSSSPKPAAGSTAPHAIAPAVENTASDQPQSNAPVTSSIAVPVPAAKSPVAPSDRIIAGDKVPATPAPQPAASNGAQPAASYMVQVAAVSSQDVADILLASLKKKGYTVAVHHEGQDKLLHVQIGPFADRKEADAMQKRVLADGFNAIVK
jgi:DedD protein